MDFVAIELGVIIAILAVISWDLGSIKRHLKGDD